MFSFHCSRPCEQRSRHGRRQRNRFVEIVQLRRHQQLDGASALLALHLTPKV